MKTLNLEKLNRIFPRAHIEGYPGCNEPGYDDKPVLLGNWNHVPNRVFDRLERLGYACEWFDDWASCSKCGKVVRTSPNCWQWQPAYAIVDHDLLCLDCIDPVEYYASIENDPNHAATVEIAYRYPPEDYGYRLVIDNLESGFHPGQNDDPTSILQSQPPSQYLFVLTGQWQFSISFALYAK